MMLTEEVIQIVERVFTELKKESIVKNVQSYSEMFKEGLFRFVIPGIIVFFATFFALQRSFEIFRLKTELRFESNEKDIERNRLNSEKQEKSFEELSKEYYSTSRGNDSSKIENT